MSTSSDGLIKTTYETTRGRGVLLWNRQLIVAHHLPAPSRGNVACNKPEIKTGVSQEVKEKIKDENIRRMTFLLERYFRGEKIQFEKEKAQLDRSNWSPFENAVADALWRVPHGELVTYAELASSAGHPRAHRAVGNFMSKNPFPVLLPCHRVVRSDGVFGGYSGGAGWKKELAAIEGSLPPRALIK